MAKILLTILMAVAVGFGSSLIQCCESKARPHMHSVGQEINTVTVDINNSNGSISQVKLIKQGVSYVGPRGEYYQQLPTEAQLKPIYGF